jgi:hypothetical protein
MEIDFESVKCYTIDLCLQIVPPAWEGINTDVFLFAILTLMNQTVAVLVVLAKGQLLMQRAEDGVVAGFQGTPDPREVTVRAAARILGQEAGLEVRPGDLEFLDAYMDGEEREIQVFVMAGVDEDRVHAYGGEDSLCKIHRNDDFSEAGLSEVARKYVIDYFKRHKKW